MIIKAVCPASCGELLQGVIGDGEKLISYPVNIYTTVTLSETVKPIRDKLRKKAVKAMYRTLEYFGESKKIGDSLSLDINSEIPVSKGMASSTADIAAAVMATGSYLDKDLSTEALAWICAQIEPTDSTIFKQFTLFDHLNGLIIEEFDWNPPLDVLVLESHEGLDTEEFRKKDYKALRKENQHRVEQSFSIFKDGYKTRDVGVLGKAATLSSLANQNILHKHKLEEIIEIAMSAGCYGVNVAHSGTVLGIILDQGRVDVEKLRKCLKEKSIHQFYYRTYLTSMVEGGAKIIYRG